ncbi:1-acyl-sn-glycerol-3-phosphate acyltransferase alpha-like [Macrosteles quadrilineatus]|uniref:1-acyl-sn-glycerol-3-phosphate acyltransferase alpha-like n=1 Tax=Macrosteles quadrilineatus TaxID=74068 RepID=UPI0023E0D766|nr:1-acyl-sn-glycerol-3-phosphate acyltransferase alpha-like [Macrosteles quadrilineatus]
MELNDFVMFGHGLASWYLKILMVIIFINIFVSLLRSPHLRYYGCYFCYVLTTSVVAFAYIPILILRFHDPGNVLLATPPIVMLTKLLGIEWELRGAKNFIHDEAAVVTVNHQSMFDIMGLLAIGPAMQRAWAVARKEIFYYWPFGLSIWLSGIIFIDRNNGRESNKKLMSAIDKVKDQKIKLVMFPEGTRNKKGGGLLPFKKGAFRMAIQGQIPITPIVLSPYYFINSEKRMFHRGKIIMSTLPPISTKGKTMADLDMLMEKTRAIMEEEFFKLKIEIEETYGLIKKS